MKYLFLVFICLSQTAFSWDSGFNNFDDEDFETEDRYSIPNPVCTRPKSITTTTTTTVTKPDVKAVDTTTTTASSVSTFATPVFSPVTAPSSLPTIFIDTLVTPSARAPVPVAAAKRHAVGFANAGANCWVNTLMHLVMENPYYLSTYKAVAEVAKLDDDTERYGLYMMNALKSYEKFLSDGQPVPPSVGQDIRVAFHNFISDTISSNVSINEDPQEALQLMLLKKSDLQRIGLLELAETIVDESSVGSMTTSKEWVLADESVDNPPSKFLESHETGVHQIILPLQGNKSATLEKMLKAYFGAACPDDSEQATLAHGDGVAEFFPYYESKSFDTVPQRLDVVLGRFGVRNNQTYKINDAISIPLHITVPGGPTGSVTYELKYSIWHQGGIGGGHYVAWKKFGTNWVLINDALATPNTLFGIKYHRDGIMSSFTPYLLHYAQIDDGDTEEKDLN